MVLLHSEKRRLGEKAPSFMLKGVDGKTYSLESFAGKDVLIVLFICNHCTYVQAIEDRMIRLQRHYASKSVQLAGICSNDSTDYPEDSPANLRKRWQEKDYRFPYLVDRTQDAARAYGAVCTPDIYVYDRERRLAYHGRLDDNWQHPDKVTRHDLREAVDALLAGKKPSEDQTPSMGCSIKWRK